MSLKLITTEIFNNLSCNFYGNTNDDILLTREQIGQALEYADPSKAIRKIHLKHKDRLDELCVRIKTNTFDIPQNGASREQNNNLVTERVYYTERGIMEICRWSRQRNANLFMDWVWDIIEKYRHNNLNTTPNIQPLIDNLTAITSTMVQMQQDINILKEESIKKPLPEKKYSRWKTKTFEKLRVLMDFVNSNSDEELKLSDIIHLVIQETEDIYDIEVNDYVQMYKQEFELEINPYAIDVINYYKDIKDMFDCTLLSLMDRFNLKVEPNQKRENIFDVIAANI